MVGFAVLGLVNAGTVIKIKAFDQHFIAGSFCFARGIKFLHHPAVAAQYVVNIAYQIITAAVKLVIIVIAAHIIAKLFIGAAMYYLAAIQTLLFAIHKAKVNNYLSVCKRLQTGIVAYKQLVSG
jgi:hypothetical protein